MYQLFCILNPDQSIIRKNGITKGFADIFKSKFPKYDDEILLFISKMFVIIRKNTMNGAKMNSDDKMSIRACKKLAEYANNWNKRYESIFKKRHFFITKIKNNKLRKNLVAL